MTAKEYLMTYQHLQHKKRTYEHILGNVEDEYISLGGVKYGDKVLSSPKNDPIGNIVISISQRKAQIGLKITQIRAQQLVIENQILAMAEIKPEYCNILACRYIKGYAWKEAMEEMHYKRTQLNKIEHDALEKFDEMFGMTYKNR